jgi:protein TonB
MRGDAEQVRRFRNAVVLSVIAHAILLFGAWPMLRQSFEEPVTPPPLVTRIVELAKPEPAPPPPPEAKPPPPRPEARKPEPPRPVPQPVPAPTIAEPQPAPSPAPVPAAPPPVAETPPSAAVAPVAPPQVDTRAVEAATAAQYRLQLIAYAQRNKPPYPAIARENNWIGDVLLEIVIRADGRGELSLRRGSGYAVLDKLALDTYQQALLAVPVPAALQGKQTRLQPLRVIYNLTEN